VDNKAAPVWSAVLKAVFLLFILLVLVVVGYTAWIVSRYWNAIGV